MNNQEWDAYIGLDIDGCIDPDIVDRDFSCLLNKFDMATIANWNICKPNINVYCFEVNKYIDKNKDKTIGEAIITCRKLAAQVLNKRLRKQGYKNLPISSMVAVDYIPERNALFVAFAKTPAGLNEVAQLRFECRKRLQFRNPRRHK